MSRGLREFSAPVLAYADLCETDRLVIRNRIELRLGLTIGIRGSLTFHRACKRLWDCTKLAIRRRHQRRHRHLGRPTCRTAAAQLFIIEAVRQPLIQLEMSSAVDVVPCIGFVLFSEFDVWGFEILVDKI